MAIKTQQLNILRDVIEHVVRHNIIGDHTYFSLSDSNIIEQRAEEDYGHISLQSLIQPGLYDTCEACQIGALFYSAVLRYDNFTVDEEEEVTYHDTPGVNMVSCRKSKIVKTLGQYFWRETLEMAENYFEKGSVLDFLQDSDLDRVLVDINYYYHDDSEMTIFDYFRYPYQYFVDGSDRLLLITLAMIAMIYDDEYILFHQYIYRAHDAIQEVVNQLNLDIENFALCSELNDYYPYSKIHDLTHQLESNLQTKTNN